MTGGYQFPNLWDDLGPSCLRSSSAPGHVRHGRDGEVFSDGARGGYHLDAALARKVVGPCGSKHPIEQDLLRRDTQIVGYRVHQPDRAGRHVHRGATSQDIMHTANLLQLRPALTIGGNWSSCAGFSRTSPTYREPGTSPLQPALRITLGESVAVWLSAIDSPFIRGAVVMSFGVLSEGSWRGGLKVARCQAR